MSTRADWAAGVTATWRCSIPELVSLRSCGAVTKLPRLFLYNDSIWLAVIFIKDSNFLCYILSTHSKTISRSAVRAHLWAGNAGKDISSERYEFLRITLLSQHLQSMTHWNPVPETGFSRVSKQQEALLFLVSRLEVPAQAHPWEETLLVPKNKWFLLKDHIPKQIMSQL